MKISLPSGVKFLVTLMLVLSAWHAFRLAQALRFWQTLEEYGIRGGPLYLAVSGAVWAGLGLALTFALGRRLPWAWGAAVGYFAALDAWFWFDRLALQEMSANLLFFLVVHLLYLALVGLVLFSRQVRNFYHEQR